MTWLGDLHFRLLGEKTGFIVNGIGDACLLLLNITGIIVWWSGLRQSQGWFSPVGLDHPWRWIAIRRDTYSVPTHAQKQVGTRQADNHYVEAKYESDP
jgi:hypothetical protein